MLGEEDDVVAEFRNPFQHLVNAPGAKSTYGPSGSLIKKLSADHSVRIGISGTGNAALGDALVGSAVGSASGHMTLEGPMIAVCKCVDS